MALSNHPDTQERALQRIEEGNAIDLTNRVREVQAEDVIVWHEIPPPAEPIASIRALAVQHQQLSALGVAPFNCSAEAFG